MLDFAKKPVIGYVQLGVLTHAGFSDTCDKGLQDAMALDDNGVDGIVVENYAEPENGPLAAAESKKLMEILFPEFRYLVSRAALGVNVLQADVVAAYGIADRWGLPFIHADVYTDHGRSKRTGAPITADVENAGRARRLLKKPVDLIATVRPWHAYEVLGNGTIEERAATAVGYGAKAIAIVGKDGAPPDIADIERAKAAVSVPVGAGSGITDTTIERYPMADFFLVSGFFKFHGEKQNYVDWKRVQRLMERKRELFG